MVDVVRVDVESNDEVEWKKSRVVGTLSACEWLEHVKP